MWLKLLKFIGWKSVVTATPHVINKAHDFYQRKFKKSAVDKSTVAAADSDLVARLDKLERLCLSQNRALNALADEYKTLRRQLKRTWLVLVAAMVVVVIFTVSRYFFG